MNKSRMTEQNRREVEASNDRARRKLTEAVADGKTLIVKTSDGTERRFESAPDAIAEFRASGDGAYLSIEGEPSFVFFSGYTRP